MRVIAYACAAMMVCSAAQSEEWRVLSGEQIATQLTGRTVIYVNATQRFYASGRTLYNAGHDSWGRWEVRGNQYCSQWPPAGGWACYDVAVQPGKLQFQGESGDLSEGVFAK